MDCFIPLMKKFHEAYGFYPKYPVADVLMQRNTKRSKETVQYGQSGVDGNALGSDP